MGGQLQQKQSMSLANATKGAGLTLDPKTNMYYQPSSGQFYQTGVASTRQATNPHMQAILGIRNKRSSNALNYGGYTFNPFTGSMDGITSGLFSPIGRYQQETRQIAPPVGILNSLFGNIDFSGLSQAGQGYGASRFLGNSNEQM